MGWVSVGINHDTAEFAVTSIRCWIEGMGRQRYPGMRELTITADCGGSNGARVRLWKVELQKLADEVAKVFPEAVVVGSDGFLRVNYSLLGMRLMTWDQWMAASDGDSFAEGVTPWATSPLESAIPATVH